VNNVTLADAPGRAAPAAARREERDFLPTLARGLAVLRVFSDQKERMTLSEVARLVGLPRATARRCLLTLQALGYVESDGKLFRVAPQVLLLSQAYLSSSALPRVAQQFLDQLSDRLGESCSVSILQGEQVIYVARSQRKRIGSLHRNVGTHLPAWCTSMGRVLLAALGDAELETRLASLRMEKLTVHTVTDPAELRARLVQVRHDGYCLIDQEMEIDLVAVAVPLRDAAGRVLAAINISTQASRVSREQALALFLPALRHVAAEMRPLLVG
jgi:IclR family pca regulon transcriptional regulator